MDWVDRDWALLYGILLGDGCIGKYRRGGRKNSYMHVIAITCNYYDDWPFVNNVVLPLLKKLTGRDIKPRKFNRRGSLIINFSDEELFIKLRGIGFPCGKKGPNVIIPRIFYEKNLMKYVIQGFFATDGSLVLTNNCKLVYPRIEAKTIHKDLMKQIYNFLIEIGIVGHFYTYKHIKQDLRWDVIQQQYRFQFNGIPNLKLFRDRIGFVNPKQELRYKLFLEYRKDYEGGVKISYDEFKKCLQRELNPRSPPHESGAFNH